MIATSVSPMSTTQALVDAACAAVARGDAPRRLAAEVAVACAAEAVKAAPGAEGAVLILRRALDGTVSVREFRAFPPTPEPRGVNWSDARWVAGHHATLSVRAALACVEFVLQGRQASAAQAAAEAHREACAAVEWAWIAEQEERGCADVDDAMRLAPQFCGRVSMARALRKTPDFTAEARPC
jgi:hypothetical protein